MQKRWNIFLFLMIMHSYVAWTKFSNYLQGFNVIAVLENIWKYYISNSKGNTHGGVSLLYIWMLQAKDFTKKSPPRFFSVELGNFFRIEIKSNSCWISQNIVSEKVKEILRRRGGGIGYIYIYSIYIYRYIDIYVDICIFI